MSFSENKSKKKKKVGNGFLPFMLEYRRKEIAKGNEIDMNTAQLEAGNLWSNMGPSEREKYGRVNADFRDSFARDGPKKFNSFGVSFDEMEQRHKDEIKRIRNIEITIEQILQTAEMNDSLRALTFFFIDTEFFTKSNDDIFPNEIAISKFSLIDGVHDTLHFLVNPGELPMGTAADAVMRSKKLHKRKLPPNTEGETNYSVIFDAIMKFLDANDSDQKTVPILYVDTRDHNEGLLSAQQTLKKIAVGSDHAVNFRVFPVEYLLLKLQKKSISARNSSLGSEERAIISLPMAKKLVTEDKFQYEDIGCEFHMIEDFSHFCCLSKVKRMGFVFVLYCLNSEVDQVLMIAGRHYPDNQKVDDEGVHSTTDGDTSWDSDLSNSFKSFQIDKENAKSSVECVSVSSSVATICNANSQVDIDKSASEQSITSVQPVASSISLSEVILKTRRGRL